MSDKFDLEFHGREYTVQRGDHPAWYISLGPKAITSLDAIPGESDHALRTRIRKWLADHPEMPDSEDIVLGGG